MAAQAQARPMARWETNKASPGGIINQIASVFTSPKRFFQQMPRTRQWVFMAMLILFIAGFTAASQGNSTQSTTTGTPQTTAVNTGAAQSGSSAASGQTARTSSQTASTTGGSTSAAKSATTTPATQQTATTDTNATLMVALLSASGVLAMWAGQSLLLCLVTMLQGYAPNLGRSMQIAVWASLPLALMLLLRQINFAAGGSGGAVGLSLLLTQWSDYAKLGELGQRIIAVFMSNLSLFWLWNLFLLYLGARYALGGSRWAVILVTAMWIISAAVVPALVSTPTTTTRPRTTIVNTQQKTTTSGSSTTTQQQSGMDMQGGGMPPSGPPPSGGMPGGNSSSSGSSSSGSR